jgi:hypothetical protein
MESWHFRKEVTLGTLLALAVYGVSFLVMVAKMDSRLTSLEAITVPQERIAIAETRVSAMEQNLDRLEARTLRSLDEIRDILKRIEQRQERHGN